MEVESACDSGKCDGMILVRKIRNDVKPIFPFPSREDLRIRTYSILKAHELLRKGVQQFLEFKESELRTYLDFIIGTDQSFEDEYNQGQIRLHTTMASTPPSTPAHSTWPSTSTESAYIQNEATTSLSGLITTMELIEPINQSFDYTPCDHSDGDVVCNQVSLETVQRIFHRTSLPSLASVTITLQPYIFTETFIPKDIFGTKRIQNIKLQHPYGFFANRSISLQVDANAFQSTKNYTDKLTIEMIDCTLLDLAFLSGFDKLTKLNFVNTYNIQHCLPTLPPLPRLTFLEFDYCAWMNELIIFPTLKNGLKNVKFIGDVNNNHVEINDETVDRLMDWRLSLIHI